MKRLFFLFLICTILALNLVSCQTDSLLKTDSQHLLLTACVYYSVPGLYRSDLKGFSIDIVDVDDYGRTLVSCQAYDEITDSNGTVYVICQKYENSTIYYYENINYIWIDCPNSNIDDMKGKNDWNEPINETKCSSREIKITLDLFLKNESREQCNYSYDKIRESLFQSFGISNEDIISIIECDWDCQGRELLLISLNNGEDLFCIVDDEYNIFIEKIEEPYNVCDKLYAVKYKSNWCYR